MAKTSNRSMERLLVEIGTRAMFAMAVENGWFHGGARERVVVGRAVKARDLARAKAVSA